MHAQNSTNQIAVFRSRDRNWPIRALEFRVLPDYRNSLFLTAFWITWPTYGHLIGRNCRVLSIQRISFVLKPKSERSTKIMHAQNSTNHIAVFRSCDRNWPIRALEFRILPDYRNFRFLTASWITWPKYGNLIGRIFPVFFKKKISFHFNIPFLLFSHPLCLPCLTFHVRLHLCLVLLFTVFVLCLPSPLCEPSILACWIYLSCLTTLFVHYSSFLSIILSAITNCANQTTTNQPWRCCNLEADFSAHVLCQLDNFDDTIRLKRVSAHAYYATTSTNLTILLTFHVILAWIWTSDLSIWCLVHYQVNQPDNHDDRWKSCSFCVLKNFLTIYIYIYIVLYIYI